MDALALQVTQTLIAAMPPPPARFTLDIDGPRAGGSKPCQGHPVIEIGWPGGGRSVRLPMEPWIVVGIVPPEANPRGLMMGYVIDMRVGVQLAGAGTELWSAVVRAAQTAGVRGFGLDAQDTGGWFWVKQGFDLASPERDAPSVVDHLRERAEALVAFGAPIVNLTRSLSHPGINGWVAQNGLQQLRQQIPAIEVPRLDDDLAPTDTMGMLPAVLFNESRWSGWLAL